MIALFGATALGKTEVALALAERSGAAKEDLAACLTSSSFPVWKRIGTK